MKSSVSIDRWCASLMINHWIFSVFFSPMVWAFDYHSKVPCCKFWLLIGPFEINRVWADEDDYPFAFGVDEP